MKTAIGIKTRHRWGFLGMGTSPQGQLLHRHVYDPPVTIMEGEKFNLTFKLTVDENTHETLVEEVESYVYREFDPPV